MPQPVIPESEINRNKKCADEIAKINERNSLLGEGKLEPVEISDDTTLYLFIKKDYWTLTDEKPDISAFGRAEMSVEAAGGSFANADRAEILRRLLRVANATNSEFAGVVFFRAGDIWNAQELRFLILHDPNDANENGKIIKQSPTHCQIICNKRSTAPRTKLRELCTVYIAPTDLHEKEDTA